MKLGILTFSHRGEALGNRLADWFRRRGDLVQVARCPSGGLDEWTKEHFSHEDGLIFVGSCGIAVRAIAPYVTSKVTDPAVVAADETGTFAVSLLSGHLGGANALAEDVAQALDALPVITTATDRAEIFAVDTWAKEQGLAIANPHRIKDVSARLLAGGTLRFGTDVVVSPCLPSGDGLHLVPAVLTLGVGCRKGTAQAALDAAFSQVLSAENYHPEALKQVCTIDRKAEEPGLLAFCQSRRVPLRTYTAEELQAVPGTFTGSDFVRQVTGTDNVCERSALLGSGPEGRLLVRKTIFDGITMALAIEPCTVTFKG